MYHQLSASVSRSERLTGNSDRQQLKTMIFWCKYRIYFHIHLVKIGQVRVRIAQEGFSYQYLYFSNVYLLPLSISSETIKKTTFVTWEPPYISIFIQIFRISCYSDSRNTSTLKISTVLLSWFIRYILVTDGQQSLINRFPFYLLVRNPK